MDKGFMGTLLVKVGTVDVEIIDDDRVAAAIRRDGKFEPDSLSVWGEICTGGKAGIVIDVGSYGGLFGIAAKLLGNQVIAIEPKPIMIRRTNANAALNGVNYQVIEAAASDHTGKANLGFNPSIALTSGSSLERKGPATMKVKTFMLDSLVIRPNDKVGAIKIDVEGHEAGVIRGALKLIEQYKPILIVEVLADETRQKAVEALLPEYQIKAVMDTRNLLMVPKT
jgi:FkbM family methyltransferase